MGAFIDDAAAWLANQMVSHAGNEVVYKSGPLSVTLTAVATMQEYEILSEEGFPQKVVSRDYLIRRADIVLGGSVAEPAPGDQITETLGVFEVLPMGDRPCCEVHDRHGVMWVVHTKQIK